MSSCFLGLLQLMMMLFDSAAFYFFLYIVMYRILLADLKLTCSSISM
uniref:Uncharacterized protein n=1 Tax=Setaria italica TaxID=4555 RepID=K3XUE3_SETIT